MAEQESILRIKIDSRNAEKNAKSVNRELQSIEKNGDFASKSMDSMSVASRSLAASLAGIVTVSAAINKMDMYTNLQNRLKLVTTTQEQLNTAMADTFAIAQNSRQAWESVLIVYQRFADNAKELNLTMAHTASLTDTVAKAVAISGATAESAQAAIVQFGQALASGVLRGEEFNSVMEQTPALAKALATGLGVNIGQLRAMANDGKLTADVLVKALDRAKVSVDDLFNRTDMTIGQSITLLSNEVTKFTGEAGKASGAASFLANSIKTLSQNLELIANVAILGGVALLTKAIATKTVAVQASIATSAQKRAADEAEIQSHLRLSALEVQRTRQVQALALTELNLARQELNSAVTRTERAAATMRLTQAEIALAIATKQVSTATAADTVLQNANAAARSRAAAAFGLIGGWTGVAVLGVTALSAAYMYMSSRTAEASAKLEEQGKVANKTTAELKALEGAQLAAAKQDLAASFEAQNAELKRLDQLIGNAIAKISSKNTADAETAKILRDVRTGVMSYDDALKILNKTYANSPDTISKLKGLINEYETLRPSVQKNADAQATLGSTVKVAGNEAQNAANKVSNNTNALNDNANAANAAANAQSNFVRSLNKTAFQTNITNGLIEKGWDVERAKLAAQAFVENNNKISNSDIKVIDRKIAADKKLKASEDAIAQSTKAKSSASKDATAQAKRDAKDTEQLLEQQYEAREQIKYSYASREKQIEADLQNEIQRIREANFSPKDTSGYIENAKNRAALESELYRAQLEQELNDWQDTEQEKLDRKVRISELLIKLDSDMNDEFKQQALNSLIDQSNRELANIQLAKEQRMFQMREAFLSENQAITARYELERREIATIADANEREFALKMSRLRQEDELRKNLQGAQNAWSNTAAQMGGYGEQMGLENTKQERIGASQNLFDAQISSIENQEQDPNANLEALAAEKERIWAEHNARMLEIERQYNVDSAALQMSGFQDIASSMTSILGDLAGKQSGAYKAMFAVEKGFAIAQSTMAIQAGISKAIALGFPQNIPVIASTIAQGAQVVNTIKSIKNGFKTGGYTGNMGVNDVAGVVHGKEYVLNAQATKRMGVGTLDAINSGKSVGGGITVNIENNGTYKDFDVQQIDERTVRIIARDEALAAVASDLSNPNGQVSRAISQNTTAGRRR